MMNISFSNCFSFFVKVKQYFINKYYLATIFAEKNNNINIKISTF